MTFSDSTALRYTAELSVLGGLLEEAEIPSELIEPTEELPLPVLLVRLPADEAGRERLLHVSFIPAEELESVHLLQWLYQMPFHTEGADSPGTVGLERLLVRVNTLTAVGHFGMNGDNEVHFRHIHALPADRTADREELLELLAVYTLMLNMFSPGLEEVAEGRMDWRKAWQDWN